MSLLGTVLLALSGLFCAPVAWGSTRLSLRVVRVLAAVSTLCLGAAAVLALLPGERAAPWLVAPAAAIAAAGWGAALTLTALSATREHRRTETAEAADPDAGLLRGGALIGLFERTAVVSALLAGWPEALAVVLALKGLGRFPELKAAQGQGVSERFILGTFASVLAACACAGVALLLRG